MKFDKMKIKKFIYVAIFCIISVIISRLVYFGIYCQKMNTTSIRGYILAYNQWDSGWYSSIIENGYQDEPTEHENGDAANWAFFPLMPMMVRFISNIFHRAYQIIGPLTNTLIFTLALIVAWYYLEETRNKKVASLFIFLMAFGMYSFYFSSTYTESLYLLFIVSFFYAMRKEKYILMGICRLSCFSNSKYGNHVSFCNSTTCYNAIS